VEIDEHDAVACTRENLRVPAVAPGIAETALRAAVDDERDRVLPAGLPSDFKLEVDSPFPITSKETLQQRPDPLEYPQNFPKYRFYGNNIKRMIDVAVKWERGDKRDGLELAIANHMKKCYLNWNKDTVDDKAIFDHLFELSDGEIDLASDGENLTESGQFLKNRTTKSNRGNSGKKSQRSNTRGKKRY
jgi:hypothetical protein